MDCCLSSEVEIPAGAELEGGVGWNTYKEPSLHPTTAPLGSVAAGPSSFAAVLHETTVDGFAVEKLASQMLIRFWL